MLRARCKLQHSSRDERLCFCHVTLDQARHDLGRKTPMYCNIVSVSRELFEDKEQQKFLCEGDSYFLSFNSQMS